jgi:hypothetical protein
MNSFLGSDRIDLDKSPDPGLPEAFRTSCRESWKVCGEGVFSWSVFRFYRARLLTHTGGFTPDEPFLMDLHYLRTLSGAQIVSTTIEEMLRLSEIDAVRQHTWSEQMLNIIPDVRLGDRLLGWFVPGDGVSFFSSTSVLGQIQDPAFVSHFSAIWLDERTRSPSLRQSLLGLRERSVVAPSKKISHSDGRLA